MATKKETIITDYPLPVYNYQVSLEGSDMSFSEVTGLNVEHEQVVYRHGFSWLMGDHLIRGRRNPINITLKRGIVKERDQLYKWLDSKDKKDLKIDLCDEAGLAIVSWEVSRALPLKLEGPSFNTTSNDVALESLELIANNLKIVYQ